MAGIVVEFVAILSGGRGVSVPKGGSLAISPVVDVEGKRLSLSNLDKVLYPATGFTKGQVIDYYARIAPALLPHLKGRPVTMKRYPNGVEAEFFYEKNAPKHRPDWVKTAPIWSRHNRRHINYLLVDDLPTLTWLANLASLEIHPSLALAKDIDCPTMMVFDLDPGAPANIVQCSQVGLWLREIFEHWGLQCFPKTSGSKGLQVYVPLNTPTTYDVTKTVCQRAGALAGARASGIDRLGDEEVGPRRKGIRGLEPERRAQDDRIGVLAAGARASDSVDARDLGGSGEGAQEERSKPAGV